MYLYRHLMSYGVRLTIPSTYLSQGTDSIDGLTRVVTPNHNSYDREPFGESVLDVSISHTLKLFEVEHLTDIFWTYSVVIFSTLDIYTNEFIYCHMGIITIIHAGML